MQLKSTASPRLLRCEPRHDGVEGHYTTMSCIAHLRSSRHNNCCNIMAQVSRPAWPRLYSMLRRRLGNDSPMSTHSLTSLHLARPLTTQEYILYITILPIRHDSISSLPMTLFIPMILIVPLYIRISSSFRFGRFKPFVPACAASFLNFLHHYCY